MSKMYREDPYDAMSEEEFEGEILAMLERTKTRAVSLRLTLDLIERTKVVAADQQVPYQTLMKAFIDVCGSSNSVIEEGLAAKGAQRLQLD